MRSIAIGAAAAAVIFATIYLVVTAATDGLGASEVTVGVGGAIACAAVAAAIGTAVRAYARRQRPGS